MDEVNNIELERKTAYIIFFTGIVANFLLAIFNILYHNTMLMTFVNFFSILVIVTSGLFGILTSRYRFGVIFIVQFVSFFEFPISIYFFGQSDLIYYLIVFPILPFIFRKKYMPVELTGLAVFSFVSLLFHHLIIFRESFSFAFKNIYGAYFVFLIVAAAIFFMCEMLLGIINNQGKANKMANKIFDTFLKPVIINLQTGSIEFIKKEDNADNYNKISNLSEYYDMLVENKVVHPYDLESYSKVSDLDYISSKLQGAPAWSTDPIRLNFNGTYEHYEHNFIALENNLKKPTHCLSYLFKLANIDSDSEDAIRLISTMFHKVLRVNFSDDTYKIVKFYESEATPDKGYDYRSISRWLKGFAEKGMVHEEDIEGFLRFTDTRRIIDEFQNGTDVLRYKYRRMTDGEWKWSAMEIIRSVDCTEDSIVAMLYVRDIDDEYTQEIMHSRMMEHYCNVDVLSGLQTRFKFYTICNEIENSKEYHPYGVVFCDLNSLKYTNDNFGHEAGDELIVGFSTILKTYFGSENCFRLSGDEFLVILNELSRSEFDYKTQLFKKDIEQNHDFIASLGCEYSSEIVKIETLVSRAEKKMYEHKKYFYETHPALDRRK